jgi:hypothetical protein
MYVLESVISHRYVHRKVANASVVLIVPLPVPVAVATVSPPNGPSIHVATNGTGTPAPGPSGVDTTPLTDAPPPPPPEFVDDVAVIDSVTPVNVAALRGLKVPLRSRYQTAKLYVCPGVRPPTETPPAGPE